MRWWCFRQNSARPSVTLRRVSGWPSKSVLTASRWGGWSGDAGAARDLLIGVADSCRIVLGPDHPETLATRRGLAFWIGAAGDAAAARDLFAALVPMREHVQRLEHPDTLGSQHELVYGRGKRATPKAPGPGSPRCCRFANECWAPTIPTPPTPVVN